MSLDIKNDVLFVGLGSSAVCYYRVSLPARALGCDWSGMLGEPPDNKWITGIVRKESQMPKFEDYKIVVLQQPIGKGWLDAIKAMQERGVKVIYEVDDYLHGIKHNPDHGARQKYSNKYLAEAEASMKQCDALIASTEWIAGNYSHFNKRVYICRNGLDVGRYDLTLPPRDTVNIGWAGATGHAKTLQPWLQQVAQLMRIRPNVCFISIGQPFAKAFQMWFKKERALALPFAAIEQYPAAMTMFDIALAPSGGGGWWKGKSDLRWLEASALGVPVIASPQNYPDIEDGVTGFHASSTLEMAEKMMLLTDNQELREKVGQQAREHVREHRTIQAMSQQWVDVFEDLVG